MNVSIILDNLTASSREETIVENVENRRCFTYVDPHSVLCEICIYDDGLCLFRQDDDHILELHLREPAHARIITEEGILKIDVKVVDFYFIDDILVMHYLIDDEMREIRIQYY